MTAQELCFQIDHEVFGVNSAIQIFNELMDGFNKSTFISDYLVPQPV